MRWRLEFYSERARILARYAVEADAPAAALERGRTALLREHPAAARQARTLFAQAQRIGGQDADGWILYRIAKEE